MNAQSGSCRAVRSMFRKAPQASVACLIDHSLRFGFGLRKSQSNHPVCWTASFRIVDSTMLQSASLRPSKIAAISTARSLRPAVLVQDCTLSNGVEH